MLGQAGAEGRPRTGAVTGRESQRLRSRAGEQERVAGEEQRFLAGAKLCSSAALFLFHLSLQLAAPCTEDENGIYGEQQPPWQPGSTGE